MAAGCCKKVAGVVFHYETIKIVDIKNKKVGALYRFVQLIILTYVIGYAIVYKKGYQETDTVISTVTTKVKGTAFVNFTNHFHSPLFRGIQVYDPTDYVIPPQENNALFIMTNMIITPNQTQSKCPEDPRFTDNLCKTDDDCLPALQPVRNGNGVRTGKCVTSDQKPKVKVCQIYGWCPVEVDKVPMPGLNFSKTKPLLEEAENFTILLKNQISFQKFHVRRRNINSQNQSYLKTCIHSFDGDEDCPVFRVKDIVAKCGHEFDKVAFYGAVYGIMVHWDCNLDYSEEKCKPVYSYNRLDDEYAKISPGFNFRYSDYYVKGDKRYRTLTKAYGLKFEILVSGKAGKFSPAPLFTNLGAGLALLGIASVMCDYIVMYCLKKRNKYKSYKYQKIEDELSTEDELDGSSDTDSAETSKEQPPASIGTSSEATPLIQK